MKEKIHVYSGFKGKISKIVKDLDSFGYERVALPTHSGEYAVSGGLISVWPTNSEEIFSLDFFGDEIETIRSTIRRGIVSELLIDTNLLELDDGSVAKPGQFVVHIDHGIGIYRRIGVKKIQDKLIKYIHIEYQNQDFLYVPANLKEKIAKYIGMGRRPKLNRLGSQSWNNSKKRAYDNAIKLARELINIYAKRELAKSEPYFIDKEWDAEVRRTFAFSETVDQEKAIKEVYADLSSGQPMDRLISGDVGFGKTEVAMRALVQAVANHKQAAIICPTTILCQQHFVNILSRLEGLPINIAMLSRFVDDEKQKSAIKKIAEGKVDIAVGTHRLLSKDVKFRDLDLIVIDEEQRFGVKQKEYFKKIRAGINVLSLSATPIPRTLFMSLSGIRDISQIVTPPKGRRSIETEVKKHGDDEVVHYINREIKRGGQVFYLYNKVETIEALRNKLQKMLPNFKFAIAHGQMEESSLSRIMSEFAGKYYDVLICTTIIENGLDLPNVNTLVVEDADNFGLSQLYQIRGRIGRSKKQAFCLLMHKENKLSENAFKRLTTLVENSDLGSGLNVALNDLEIRGGGNIIGREQHGNLEAVGLTLYSQMLKRAVDNLVVVSGQ